MKILTKIIFFLMILSCFIIGVGLLFYTINFDSMNTTKEFLDLSPTLKIVVVITTAFFILAPVIGLVASKFLK